MEQDQTRTSNPPGKQETLWHTDCSPAAGPLMRQAKHSQTMVSGFPKAALHTHQPHNHNTFFNNTECHHFLKRCFLLNHEAHLFWKRFDLFKMCVLSNNYNDLLLAKYRACSLFSSLIPNTPKPPSTCCWSTGNSLRRERPGRTVYHVLMRCPWALLIADDVLRNKNSWAMAK